MQKDIKTITGIIAKVKQRAKGYSIKIGSEWYSAWGQAKFKEGDRATINYFVNEKGYNDLIERDEVGDFQKPDPKAIQIIPDPAKHAACNLPIKETKWRRVPVKEVVDRRTEALLHAIGKLPKIKEEFLKAGLTISNISTIETILGILTVRADSLNEKSEE